VANSAFKELLNSTIRFEPAPTSKADSRMKAKTTTVMIFFLRKSFLSIFATIMYVPNPFFSKEEQIPIDKKREKINPATVTKELWMRHTDR
jgi:hypothetical protein